MAGNNESLKIFRTKNWRIENVIFYVFIKPSQKNEYQFAFVNFNISFAKSGHFWDFLQYINIKAIAFIVKIH